MAATKIEIPPDFAQWVIDEAARREMTPEALLEELRNREQTRPKVQVEVLDARWDPSVSVRRREHNPWPDKCYVVLQVGLRIFNSGPRRYLARDFRARITMGDDVRDLDHAGSLPSFLEPPPVRGGVQAPSAGYNVDPRYGDLVLPGEIARVDPDDFTECSLNFKKAPAGPLEVSGLAVPFTLSWTDQDGRRFEVPGTAHAIVIGYRPLR